MDKITFQNKYNDATSGLFKDNTTKDIGADDVRALVTDVGGNIPFTDDDSYSWPFPGITTSGGTTAYTGTLAPAITGYSNRMKVQVKINATSTGASTLNLNTQGAKKVYVNPTTQADAGDLLINQTYIFVYDTALDGGSGGFIMIGSGGGGGGSQDLQSVLDQGSTAVLTAGITITGAFDVILGDGGSKLNSFSVLASSGFNVQSNNGTASAYVIGNSTGLDLRWQDGLGLDGHLLMNPSGNFFSGSSAFTFTPTATVAGFNFGSVAADPSTLNNADVWYDNVLHLIRARVNGASVSLLTSATGLSNSLASARILVGNGSNVATAVDMSGQATIDNTGAVTLSNAAVIGKVLTGYVSGAGTVAATDTILEAIQKLNGNDATKWSLASGGALTANNTISGAFQVLFNLTVEDGFRVTGSFTASDSFAQAATFAPTVTGRGTSNDIIIGTWFNPTLTNSTGVAVNQIAVRISPSFTGSVISGPLQKVLQIVGGSSTALTELIDCVNSAGQPRWKLRGDGTQVWLTTLSGTNFQSSITNLTASNGLYLYSGTIGGPSSSPGTTYHTKLTNTFSTNVSGTTFINHWDNRTYQIDHTTAIVSGFLYDPIITGTQAGTETHYAFRIASGLSGFGITTPTARLQARGLNNGVAVLAEDDAGNAIASFGESGGARVIGFFGATPVVQQTMGAATAGAAYTATEQTMLQAVYDAVRNIGIGT